MVYDCVIIGGGPSGLMAAVQLEKMKKKYLLLEKNDRVGKKLLISGNKRCNVTNNLDVETFVNQLTIKNKRFLYSALYQFGPNEVINYFKENNLDLVLENNFKYFPATNRAQSVLDALVKNIDRKRIIVNAPVSSIALENDIFTVSVKNDEVKTRNIIVATGSNSFPATGSNGEGLKLAKQMGIEFNQFSPAETHIFSNEVVQRYSDLQGTAITKANVKIANTKYVNTGDLLFTHFGLSGPAIYHLAEFIYSELLKGPVTLEINLSGMSAHELTEKFISDKKNNIFLSKSLETFLSKRVAKKVMQVMHMRNINMIEISQLNLEKLAKKICEFPIKVDRVEDKEKAYVNKGGILLKELNPKSMESKKVPGLFFTGETVDVHGPIGGFNITIAFATAILAASKISDSIK